MAEEAKRPVSDARKKANAKFNATAYDRIELKVIKGRKEEIKAHATKYQPEVGEIGKAGYSPKGSITGFINRAIDGQIERDTGDNSTENVPVDRIKLTDEEKAHIEKRREVLGQVLGQDNAKIE